MSKKHESFKETLEKSANPFSLKIPMRMAASLDSECVESFVLQAALWVQDGIQVVIRQMLADEASVSPYLGLVYPDGLDAATGRERDTPCVRQTLLYRIRHMLRRLLTLTDNCCAFSSWNVSKVCNMLREFYFIIASSSLPKSGYGRLEKFVKRFCELWNPSSDIQSAEEMEEELSALLELVGEAFEELERAFRQKEDEIRLKRLEEAHKETDKKTLEQVQKGLVEVSECIHETSDTAHRIEARQCRRAGVSVPIPASAQDACLKIWTDCKAHPEWLFKDVSRRRVKKADAYDWAVKMKRLPHAVETYASFVRAIDLGRKRQRSNALRDEGNREGNEGNPRRDEGNHEGNGNRAVWKVLAAIRRCPSITISALAQRLGLSHATIERAQKSLLTAGRIRRKGGTRGVWEVLA